MHLQIICKWAHGKVALSDDAAADVDVWSTPKGLTNQLTQLIYPHIGTKVRYSRIDVQCVLLGLLCGYAS